MNTQTYTQAFAKEFIPGKLYESVRYEWVVCVLSVSKSDDPFPSNRGWRVVEVINQYGEIFALQLYLEDWDEL